MKQQPEDTPADAEMDEGQEASDRPLKGRKRRKEDPDGDQVQPSMDKEARMDGIKNKDRRRSHMVKIRREKKKEKKARQLERKKAAEALGPDAPPKLVPKTLESTREYDETTVKEPNKEQEDEDEEVSADINNDEFKAYFDRAYEPKVLLTSADDPKSVSLF